VGIHECDESVGKIDGVAVTSDRRIVVKPSTLPRPEVVMVGLLIARHPCVVCTFALATHGVWGAAFGLGEPSICVDHAHEDRVKWRLVEDEAYPQTSREAMVLLGITRARRAARAVTASSRFRFRERP
jgi:hypothetical protein